MAVRSFKLFSISSGFCPSLRHWGLEQVSFWHLQIFFYLCQWYFTFTFQEGFQWKQGFNNKGYPQLSDSSKQLKLNIFKRKDEGKIKF